MKKMGTFVEKKMMMMKLRNYDSWDDESLDLTEEEGTTRIRTWSLLILQILKHKTIYSYYYYIDLFINYLK